MMTPRYKNRTPRTEAKMNRLLNWLRSFGGQVFPKLKTIKKRLGWSISTIQRVLAELKRDGKISWRRRGPTSCIYYLHDPARMEHSLEHPLEHSKPRAPLSEVLEQKGTDAPHKMPRRETGSTTNWFEVSRLSRAGVPFDEAVRRATA